MKEGTYSRSRVASQLDRFPLPLRALIEPLVREDDPKLRCPDITLAKTLLGWAPRVPLREGLGRMIEHVRDVEGMR